jgi:16S rRNA (uracil1498-N3)-methyltransferase
MHKFFVPKENIYNDIALIEGDDVKHIYKVLRLEKGHIVNINNCDGEEYIGEIISVDKKEVQVLLKEKVEINRESSLKISLFQGLPKSSKMDLIVQKAAELGIMSITPLLTERVVVKSEISEFTKTERWKRIALEACKQCKRSIIPEINTPIEFNALISSLSQYDLIIVPYENEKGYGIKNLIKDLNTEIRNVSVIIGPEGGFEEDEINSLKDQNAKIVTLGPRILRTETAGFVCASILQYELGDLGGY